MIKKKYDVFISHASADKKSYVENLVNELANKKIKVFYDDKCIQWGDNIQEKIDEGLRKCRYAIVVISENFLGRDWTEYELHVLLERQSKEKRNIILPILHGISKAELEKHYPSMCNIKFLHSKSCSAREMAEKIVSKLM